MALLWFGGFENLSGSELVSSDFGYFTTGSYGFPGNWTIPVNTFKASGNYSLRFSNSDRYIWFDVGGDAATIIFGIAVLNAMNPSSTKDLIRFYTTSHDLHCSVRSYVSGVKTYFIICDSVGGTLATSSGVFLAHQASNTNWWYFECKITINATTGACVMKVNNIEIMNETNLDTYGSGTVGIGRIFIGNPISTSYTDCYIDDIYILDTNGSAPCNDFLGPVRVEAIVPNADGTHTDWTANTGDRYAALDEVISNEDTTYVYGSTATDRISTQFENVTITETIFGIVFRYCIRFDGYTSVKVTPFLRINSTDYDNAVDDDLVSAWKFYFKVYENNPDDSAAWEDADIDALEAGIYLESITS